MRPFGITLTSLLVLGFLATSASGQVYVYPEQGQSQAQQQSDQQECSSWASRETGYVPGQSGQVGKSAVRGGARGAAGGAIIGAASGGSAGKGAGVGALLGGVTSGVRGAAKDQQAQSNWSRAYIVCLEAKGYSAR